MNAVITERAIFVPSVRLGSAESLTVPAFEVRCCNCGVAVWSSQHEGAGRNVTMDEILFRLQTHACAPPQREALGDQSPDGPITKSTDGATL